MALSSGQERDPQSGIRLNELKEAAERNGVTVDAWRTGDRAVIGMITESLGGKETALSRPDQLPQRSLIYQIGVDPPKYSVIWTGYEDHVTLFVKGRHIPESVLPIMKASDTESRQRAIQGVQARIIAKTTFALR
jgi:hypothetical protein